jgi:nickel/cobalt exporter
MLSLIWAALIVATLHALLPMHWLPYVTVATTNKSSVARLLGMTVMGTLIHLASTAALTALALLLSFGTTHTIGHGMERAGGLVLVLLALLYLFLPARVAQLGDRVTWFLAVGVGIQPCVELVPLILVAALSGPTVTALVGAIWAATTMVISLALVLCGYWSFKLGWIRSLGAYAHLLTGGVLLLCAAGLFWHTH